MGIVGLGRIGRAVARRSQAFDMSIAYTGRAPKNDVPYRWCDSVLELAAEVDFLVVCASGGPATRGLIDAEVLQALGPQGVLVNVGRGSIVDEQALRQALQERTIAAAALDVFVHEPQVPEALMNLPNTVLTPHMASSTRQGLQAMLAQAEAYLLQHFGLPEITD
ncbi:2-ketogluconate reductase [bioreactor metagenome]|uniref:2-ketogluconate reductase n=1 Tax=bioreactor metagenome TaxID=1076179 RepID=A0A645GUZ4_9ZZZZ